MQFNSRRYFLFIFLFLISVLAVFPFTVSSQVPPGCEYSSTSPNAPDYCMEACEQQNIAIPLTDRASNDYYLGDTKAGGGLYHNGTNIHPLQNLGAGIASDGIVPLNSDGDYDPVNGVIGMFSIGMSNTTKEFTQFVNDYFDRDTGKPSVSGLNPYLRVVDGAQGGTAVDTWANSPTSSVPWSEVATRLSNRNIDPNQVQVVWIKQAERNSKAYPTLTNLFKEELKVIIDKVVTEYPNTKIIFLSSRTRAHRVGQGLSPEPQAYEYGFGIKWLVEEYVNGSYVPKYIPNNVPNPSPVPHDVFLAWGPYLWIDGNNTRSDGKVWPVTRLAKDCIHPSAENFVGEEAGAIAVSDMLYDFFITDPKAAPWFTDGGPVATLTPTNVPSQAGDIDGDGDIDIRDRDLVFNTYGSQGIYDFNKIVKNFGI